MKKSDNKKLKEKNPRRHEQITLWCHEVIKAEVEEGGLYVDATMGKGNDTLFFCELAGMSGKVYAFDIQPTALEKTASLLKVHQMERRAELILDGHENMDHYLRENSADAICFNFGYLPEGDHKIATRAESSLEAVKKGLAILKPQGMMSLCIYSGGDTGFEEKEVLLNYLRTLPAKQYTVIANEYLNRDHNPPMPVFIFKK